MERLTEEKQIGPFATLKDKAEAIPGAFGTYDCFYAHMVAVTRLKEYEDAMPIERAQELAQIEKDGRLVAYMLGEKVYDRFGNQWIVETSEVHLIGGNMKQLFRCGHPGTEDYCAMYRDEILTREEAEATLKKRETGHDG